MIILNHVNLKYKKNDQQCLSYSIKHLDILCIMLTSYISETISKIMLGINKMIINISYPSDL
jgi:hypothetical protein